MLSRFRTWWQRLFFWQQTRGGSHEFKPETHHDHALVLFLQTPASRWHKLRLLGHVLSLQERRLLLGSLCVGFLALLVSVGFFIRPHLFKVPVSGGVFTEALVGSPKLINPLYAPLNDVDRDLSALIYSGLFRLNGALEPEPDIAARYRWIEDGRLLEITLREDVRFHDGIPLTADDVVFTYETAANSAWRSPLASTFRLIEPIRIDTYTIQLKLEKPNPHLLTDLTLGILPQHIWGDVPGGTASLAGANLKPIGSGPYRLESFKRDTKGALLSFKLAAFSGYYDQHPFIDVWQFRFYPDRLEAQAALENKQADAIAFVPWKDVEELRHSDIQSATIELPQETVAFLNVKHPLLQDVRLRQALRMAVDLRELQDLIGNHASLVSSPFPFLQSTTTQTGDLEGARVLLNTLGWRLPANGTIRVKEEPRQASSTELHLTIDLPDQSDLVKVAELLQRRWSLIGVRVDVRTAHPEELLKRAVTKRDYQVLIWNVLIPPTQDISPFWASEEATESGLNLANLTDREVDRALASVASATSSAYLAQAREDLSRAILKQTPALFLLRPAYAYLLSRDVQGVKDMRVSRPSDRLLRTKEWFLETGWRWR